MRQRDPFGSAVTSLRAALEYGLAPGQHLSVADIAASLKLSTSPVREALSRLCGEGLVEDRRGPRILQPGRARGGHCRSAGSRGGPRPARGDLLNRRPGPVRGSDAVVEAWIAGLLEHCENQPLVESLLRVRSRLAPLRRLNGPISPSDDPEPDYLEAYYARWRRRRRACGAGQAAGSRRLGIHPQYRLNRFGEGR